MLPKIATDWSGTGALGSGKMLRQMFDQLSMQNLWTMMSVLKELLARQVDLWPLVWVVPEMLVLLVSYGLQVDWGQIHDHEKQAVCQTWRWLMIHGHRMWE